MSAQGNHEDAELQPTFAEGYKPTAAKSLDAYRELDKEDESLARWKASLGIGANAPAEASGPKVTVISLTLTSDSLFRPIVLHLSDKENFKKNPITIKEGAEYSVTVEFKVNHGLTTGLRFIQVVKRAGLTVDRLDAMIGSYTAGEAPYRKQMHTESAPSGLIARSGSYTARSRVTDDDKEVYADFEWVFKLGKEW
ncbi:E set domain-containing protein [Dacryopinax primogenitus]|uniref:E set domain-containing protein n=1 Tax=Dacryopinax primogenitus (strain DJM 731) TaxID=1858805 RepID=M5FRT3_DACPD|nr:E set domain-containing protein [Dacryopinax primogenitus]EJT97744.1 E set domain-containing protein [Dacryopinax primogenitus]